MTVKEFKSNLAEELGKEVNQILEQVRITWDEAYIRYSSPTPNRQILEKRVRRGRDLNGFEHEIYEQLPENKTMARLNAEIEAVEGQRPAVILLNVRREGFTRLAYDMESEGALSLAHESIGEPSSYFGPNEIQIPEETQNRIDEQTKWDGLLTGRPVLRLNLPDKDFGMPFPDSRFRVERLINDLLKPAFEGKVLDMEWVEGNGTNYDVLIIGVVDLDTSLPKLLGLLKSINVHAGATLTLDGKDGNLARNLASRDEVIFQAANTIIEMILQETRKCSPPDWKTGTLTIQCNGEWLDYKLKNTKSSEAASISARLQALCEDLAFYMWKFGKKWREVVLQYDAANFTVNFSYEEPADPIPRGAGAAAAEAAKPWWKFW